ncbi:MAG TPA: hypothetical protein VKB95_00400, partial [Chitinophagaceae bacterium]|nr:hypothetical protein [Chitinophagaceae bacterium]
PAFGSVAIAIRVIVESMGGLLSLDLDRSLIVSAVSCCAVTAMEETKINMVNKKRIKNKDR